MSKGKHQEEITKELSNIFESLKLLTSSITALVKLLMKDSISSAKEEDFKEGVAALVQKRPPDWPSVK